MPDVTGKTTEELAREVLRGEWGSGATRKRLLGNLYEAVQARVNEILLGTPRVGTTTMGTAQNAAMEAKRHALDVLFAGARTEAYWVEIVDRNDKVLGRLDGMDGGTITGSVDARIKSAGKLHMTTKTPVTWWGDRRLKVWVDVNGYKWPLGVFIPESPDRQYSADGVNWDIALYDKLSILDDDCVPSTFSLPSGTRIIDTVVRLIVEAGETNIAITPSDRTLKSPKTWEAGTPKLTIINDLLDYCEYFSLVCDGNGQYRASPYVVPGQRPVSWQLHEGTAAIHTPDFKYTHDTYNVPNRVVYLVQTAGTGIPGVPVQYSLRAAYENHDPKSMFSYENRGRWVTQVKTDASAETQAELDAKVKRRIERATAPMERIELSMAVMPVQFNEIVYFKSQGVAIPGTVRKWEVELTPGELMKTTLRRINTTDMSWREEESEEDED